ncbi:MAG: DUF6261 family protein [Bacteroidia bacterium]|nr:DUF6261 family protein [Bacteroidia bacterium]
MKPNLGKLSLRSLDTGTRLIIELTRNNAQESAKTNPVFLEVENQHNIFAPLVPKEHYTGMSQTLKELRNEIKSDIRNIKKLATATVGIYPGSEKADATQIVLNAIKKGGNLSKGKADDVDSRITTIMNQFALPETTAAFTTLELTPMAEALAEKKKRYDDGSVERLDKKSEIRQTENASIARPRLESALKDYLSLVTAMRKVEGWQDLYADLNEAVKRMKRSVKENKELDEITPETTEP